MNVGNIFKNLTWLDALIIAAIFLLSLFLQIAFLHSDGKTPRIARVNAAGSEYIFSRKRRRGRVHFGSAGRKNPHCRFSVPEQNVRTARIRQLWRAYLPAEQNCRQCGGCE